MKGSTLLLLCGLGCTLILSVGACSSSSSRDYIERVRDSAHPHVAAIGMDNFWTDYRSPHDRNVQHFDFYYKHCIEDEFKPYPDHVEFMCTGPY